MTNKTTSNELSQKLTVKELNDKYDLSMRYSLEEVNTIMDELKKELLFKVSERILDLRLKQREVAELFGAKQSRISNIKSGSYERFSIEAAMTYAIMLGVIKTQHRKSQETLDAIEHYNTNISHVKEDALKIIEGMKRELIDDVSVFLFKSRLKQREIACVLDVKQPRVSDLMNTRYQKFNYGSAKMYSILFGLTKVKQKRK